jgi:O-acetyl-ADP-ribose deacetylase (regulator of RNase III)
MKEIVEDFWEVYKEYDAIVCPTNGVVKKNGELVMGGGLAKQFKDRFPYIPLVWGQKVQEHGNHVYIYKQDDLPDLFSFPSKQHWREMSNIRLIERSAYELTEWVNKVEYESVLVPKIGCGLGGLTWGEVKPVLERYLDGRFIIISK